MNNLERARAQSEAQKSERQMTSADRARFWAGLNRYLKAEAVHEHHASEHDDDLSAGETHATPDEP